MESNEVEAEFDWDELLVTEEERYAQKRTITIDVETLVDEDGDDAIQIHFTSSGLDKRGMALALELAYQIVEQEIEDPDDD